MSVAAFMQPSTLAFCVQVGAEHHVQWFQDPSRSIGNLWSHGIAALAVVLQVSVLITSASRLLLLCTSTGAHPTIGHLLSLKGLWSFRFMPGSVYASPLVGFVLIIGRLVCASVEVWVLLAHITGLMQQDEASRDSP